MKNTCRAGVPIEADKPCPRCGANRNGSCTIGDMQAEAELRAEIGRLKAEMEEARQANSYFRRQMNGVMDLFGLDKTVTFSVEKDDDGSKLVSRGLAGQIKQRAETAEAAAGAMREALGWALAVIENLPSFRRERNCFVTLLESENEGFTAEWRKARKAASATIGADVMRVVRAARELDEMLCGDTALPTSKVRNLHDALAALGGTHER